MSAFDKKTNISWANRTWNVLAGCEKVSPACKNCYSMFVGNEAESKGVAKYKGLTTIATNGKPVWTGKVNIAGEKLFNEPKRWKESSIIFVNSMSDLFYEEVPKDLVFKIFDKMLSYNWHKYLVLTKRSERMKTLVNEYCELKGFDKLPDFIWLGVSVENEKVAEKRINDLNETKSSISFISAEPLLEEVDFSKYPIMDWYIVGGESVEIGYDPKDARPFNVDWARKIRDFCKDSGAAFHMKQIGCNPIGAIKTNFKGDKLEDIPEDLLIREYPFIKI